MSTIIKGDDVLKFLSGELSIEMTISCPFKCKGNIKTTINKNYTKSTKCSACNQFPTNKFLNDFVNAMDIKMDFPEISSDIIVKII